MSKELANVLTGGAELAKKMADAGLDGPHTFTVEEAEASTGIKANRFFPFLQLLQRTSNAIGDHKPGTFLFKRSGQDKNPINLGDAFDSVVIAVRGKATYYDGETVKAEYHTPKQPASDQYKEFIEKGRLESGPNAKYRSGLDVLIWIKELKSFATYFANTPSTTANVETMVVPYAPRTLEEPYVPVSLIAFQRSNKKGTWFVPSTVEISKDVADLWEPKDLFTGDGLTDALKLFLLPPKSRDSSIEGAEEIDPAKRTKRSR